MKRRVILLIALLLPFAVLYNAGLLELRLEEPRRAIVALEMLLRNSYIVPEIHGELYYTKPPLFNWMIALSFWLAGSYSEWAARMPGLLSYFATGIMLYWFAKQFFSKEKALLAAFFFYTASDLFLFGTIISAEIDLFFAFIITLQQVLLYYFFSKTKWLVMFAASYLVTALAVLTKGLPAILFQGVSIVVLVIYHRQIKLLWSWQHLAGILVFILVAGSYFYAYEQQSGQLYPYLAKLYYDATEKSVLEHSLWQSVLNLLMSPLSLLRFFAPWFVYIIFLFRKSNSTGGFWQNKTIGFITWSVAMNIIPMLFTANTKANYIYPLYPFIALMLAHIYMEYKSANKRLDHVLNMIFWSLMFAVLAAVLIAPFFGIIRDAIEGLWYKTMLLCLLLGGLIYQFSRHSSLRIYFVILFMVVTRLLVSVYYLPLYKYSSTQQRAKAFIEEVTKQAEGSPVHLAGAPGIQEAYLAVGPLKFDTVRISMPPFVQYQVPFYYTAITNKMMPYDPGMKAGTFYIIYTENPDDTAGLRVVSSYQPSRSRKPVFYLVRPATP